MATRDLVDLVLLGALWGASFLFMRMAAPEFGPVPLIAVRVSIAMVVLVGLVLWRGGLRAMRPVAVPLLLVGATNTAVPFSLLAYAALTLPAGLSSTLNASVPLFGAVIGFAWLGVRPSPRRVLGLVVGFAGVLVLAWPRLTTGSDWRAVVAALSATVLYGLAAHITQRTLRRATAGRGGGQPGGGHPHARPTRHSAVALGCTIATGLDLGRGSRCGLHGRGVRVVFPPHRARGSIHGDGGHVSHPRVRRVVGRAAARRTPRYKRATGRRAGAFGRGAIHLDASHSLTGVHRPARLQPFRVRLV